jgi:RNA polymerase sigma factor (sigma-70 family)
LASDLSPSVAKQLHGLFHNGTALGLSDGSLLDRFRDAPAEAAEAAFAVLVERHAPMVLHVCRGILRDRHDAEDAAQAVFLVLARQAGSIRRADAIASWLYGVAARVAARARLDATRRRLRERRAAEASLSSQNTVQGAGDQSELWTELYQELARLPERFRLPILFCHLEGLTYEQAAQRLGCPVRTIQSRLARGRGRLRDRLIRRGVEPSFVPLASGASLPVVSDNWKNTTVVAAVRYLGGGHAAGLIPPGVAVLAEGASRTMTIHRCCRRAAVLTLIGVGLAGAGMGMRARSAPIESGRHVVDEPAQNRFRAAMAGGTSFEVIAVSSFPSGPNTWWQPDGTPIAEAPADPLPYPHRVDPNEKLRTVLVQVSGLPNDAYLRWLPTFDGGYSGHSPTKAGQKVRGLEAYIISVRQDRKTCDVKARLATGSWKTEVSNDGRGGTGTFVNGHKYCFGKARLGTWRDRPATVFAVAHNFFGQDRRLVAIDREGKPHPAMSYSAGSDGDEKWVIDLIDGEFALAPDQITKYEVQFRPFEIVEIKDVALNPR